MKFEDIKNPRRGALGLQAWIILVGLARNWQVTTYQRLADILQQGTSPFILGPNVLDPVAQYCIQNGLPPLTALVLSKATAKPGGGFPAYEERAHQLVEVFEFDWYSQVPPTIEELDQASKDAR